MYMRRTGSRNRIPFKHHERLSRALEDVNEGYLSTNPQPERQEAIFVQNFIEAMSHLIIYPNMVWASTWSFLSALAVDLLIDNLR